MFIRNLLSAIALISKITAASATALPVDNGQLGDDGYRLACDEFMIEESVELELWKSERCRPVKPVVRYWQKECFGTRWECYRLACERATRGELRLPGYGGAIVVLSDPFYRRQDAGTIDFKTLRRTCVQPRRGHEIG